MYTPLYFSLSSIFYRSNFSEYNLFSVSTKQKKNIFLGLPQNGDLPQNGGCSYIRSQKTEIIKGLYFPKCRYGCII